MPICAVCGKENETLLCKSCGFDGSCDYEKYPSLARPVKRPDPVSRRRAVLKADSTADVINQQSTRQKENDSATLRCAKCGGTQFSVDVKTGELLCSACSHRFSMADSAPKKAEPVTPPPVSKPAVPTPPPVSKPATPPPVSKPAVPTPPPVTQPAKPKRSMLERLTLGLGWILMGLDGFAILQGGISDPIGSWAALLALNLIMQIRLMKKGFSPLFGSKIPMVIHNFCYIYMALIFFVITFVELYFVTGSTDLFDNEMERLALIAYVIVMPLYFSFWALGQRGSRKKK